ncbi:hypothetical protein LCGC14_2414580 [marine sediment metagenome]|uniref:Uncharacterized protein n=1 Tax=marine sediment metagenome TaxID=412755 RepID=A0A0F9EKV1_9ZZZZ
MSENVTTTPRRYDSIEEIIQANESIGHCWFSPSTTSFFRSKVYPEIYGGRFFVSSEKTSFDDPTRVYTVREVNDRGAIVPMYPREWHKTKAQAVGVARDAAREL